MPVHNFHRRKWLTAATGAGLVATHFSRFVTRIAGNGR